MDGTDKRLLFVDDQRINTDYAREAIARLRSESGIEVLADIPEVRTIEGVESCLRSTPYALIMMDGNLGLDLPRTDETTDGHVIVRALRRGAYGPLNQETPVLSMSDAYKLPEANVIDGGMYPSKGSMKGSFYLMKQMYEKFLA